MAGHIRRRDQKWQARYPDPARKGRKVERTFRTRREAEDWLTQQGATILQGTHIDPRRADRPFADVIDAWRDTWVNLGPVTRAGYEGILRKHIVPAWGDRKVGAITHEAVQRWVTSLSATLAPGTTRNVYAVLRAACAAGVRLGLLRTNPCLNVRLPRPPRHEMLHLTADEVRALADAITPHYRALVLTAAYTGLRAGELAGLRRADVDLLRGVLRVRQAQKEINGHISYGPPKTHQHRTVALPTFLRDLLAVLPPSGDYVFTTEAGHPIRRNNFLRRHWQPAVRAALPAEKHGLRFHDLRHTCASLLIAAGAHPKAIQERLGHSSIQITMDRYGHLLPSADTALAAALDATHSAAATPLPPPIPLRVARSTP